MNYSEYVYDKGELLENRNTYQYTKYEGIEFLEAWKNSRENIIQKLNVKPILPQPSIIESLEQCSSIYNSEHIIDFAVSKLHYDADTELHSIRYIDTLLKKFEVSKRLYLEYDLDFKPVKNSRYDDLPLYVKFGRLMELAYSKSKNIKYLNTLLKALDTLCAYNDHLVGTNKSILCYLIKQELKHIKSLTK